MAKKKTTKKAPKTTRGRRSADNAGRISVKRPIAMDDATFAVVKAKADELAKETGEKPNISLAIRAIIRDWATGVGKKI